MSNVVKLKEVVKIIGGGTPSKSEKAFYDNGTIKWATVGDMNTDLIVDTELKITEKAVNESSTNILTTDAIVIATRVGLGKVCYLESETAINQDLKGLLPNNDRLTKEYLYYFFKSITKYIIENGTGATVKGVKLDFINDIDIPLPPLSEQQRIVSKLDLLFEKIDKSIALHQKNMDEANAFIGSVLNDVFEELEEKYGLKQISEIILKTKNINPTTEEDRSFTYIDISSVNNKSFKIEEPKYLIGKEAPSRAKKEVKFGDIVFATTRPNLKNIAMVTENYDNPIASTGFCILRVNEKNVNKYLFFYLLTNKLFEQIEPKIRGAQYPAVSDKDLIDCFIPNTPLQIQQKTVTYLDEIFQKIEKIKQLQKEKMASLKALKASILDSAFRGEL